MDSGQMEIAAHGSRSIEFLADVAPALGLEPEDVTRLEEADIAPHYDALLERAEAVIPTIENAADRRIAELSAIVLRSMQHGGANLPRILRRRYQFDKNVLPAIVEQTASWVCAHLVETKEPVQEHVTDAMSALPAKQTDATLPRPDKSARKEMPKKAEVEKIEILDTEEPSSQDLLETEDIPEESGAEPWFDKEARTLLEEVEREGTTAAHVDLLRVYLRDIGRRPLLKAEEEVDLAQRIEAGLMAGYKLADAEANEMQLSPEYQRDLMVIAREGQRARQCMIESNLRLVVSLAKRQVGRGLHLLDLIQEGSIGLIRAVEKYDYTQGHKFSTYATWWIRQAIGRGIADHGRVVRIPVHRSSAISKMRRTTEELLKDLGRSPTTDEIAAELKTTKADVERMRTESAFPISLDAPVRNDGDAKHGDFISDEGPDVTFDILRRGDFSRLAKALERLEPLEQQVLALRFGGDSMPFSEVAKELSLAEHIVRRIGRRVMAKLMHPSQALEDLRDETLGNEERADWQSDGVCREIGIEAFFSDTAKKHINGSLKSTKRICQDCPVRDVCLKFALDNNINEGIWGGASPPDRGRLLASV